MQIPPLATACPECDLLLQDVAVRAGSESVCPRCGHVLRPRVVLFGENLPPAAVERFFAVLDEGFDMVFSIGTSSNFPYIVEPVLWASQSGITTVEINPGQTVLSEVVEHRLPLGAAAAMTALLERLGQPSKPA